MKRIQNSKFLPRGKAGKIQNSSKGAVLLMVLVFGTIFLLIFSSLGNFIYTQYQQSRQKVAFYQAMAIAEAGADYARWHLAHDPNNFDFSGTYDYSDPETDIIGQYQLEITPPIECSTTVEIKSTGWSNDYSKLKRAVLIKYGRPSLAQYAFLTNSDVWFGEEEELRGPFHSNGGIRMDGEQNALATSAKETYICQPYHGCSPAQEKPGIWGEGNGGEEGLWSFPVPGVDFNAITLDLSILKEKAQDGGYYFGSSGGFGYHLKFKNNGTFDLYKVTKLKPNVWGTDTQGNRRYESNDIDKESFLGNYVLATGKCNIQNLIFLEDSKVWVEGVIKEKATVIAARFPDNPSTNASIIINGNLTRADPKATLVALITQKNVLVPLYSPNVLEIQAVMLAQKGAVQRYYYSSTYSPWHIRNRIMVRGSIITNQVWTWTWVSGGGSVVSGYRQTESYYESALIYNPPPYFPSAGEHQFISWEEVK